MSLFELFKGERADHAPVGHEAHLPDPETPSQALHDRHQRSHIGGIAGPKLTADRVPVTVDDDPYDHLFEIRSMVLAVTILAQALATRAFEINRRRIEEHQLQGGE